MKQKQQRAYNIRVNGKVIEVVGGEKAGRFVSSGNKTKARKARSNGIVLLRLIGFLLLTKKGLKFTFWIIAISWFLSTITISFEPPQTEAQTETQTETITQLDATGFESADIPKEYREVKAREARAESVQDIIKRVFGKDASNAIKIADCESRFNPTIINDNPKTKDYSIGVFQINIFGKLAQFRPSAEQLKDAEFNIKYAKMLFDSKGGFSKDWAVCSRINNIK